MLAYRKEATILVDGLKVRPSLSICKAAIKFGMPVAVNHEDIERARAEALKWERFNFFCEEDGIPPGGKLVKGNRILYYQPDAMGYPTLIMETDLEGNLVD